MARSKFGLYSLNDYPLNQRIEIAPKWIERKCCSLPRPASVSMLNYNKMSSTQLSNYPTVLYPSSTADDVCIHRKSEKKDRMRATQQLYL